MLSVGEPDFDTPQIIKDACAEAMMRGETKYTVPAGIGELREACAAKFNADGVKTTASQIIVTPGGKFACGAAIAAAGGPPIFNASKRSVKVWADEFAVTVKTSDLFKTHCRKSNLEILCLRQRFL